MASAGAIERAVKIQNKAGKKGAAPRIGEILVSLDEMKAPERDALLSLQRRVRGTGEGATEGASRPTVLVLEEGPASRQSWRPVAAALVVGMLLALLAVVIAFAVFR
jgi:hypothetical protein